MGAGGQRAQRKYKASAWVNKRQPSDNAGYGQAGSKVTCCSEVKVEMEELARVGPDWWGQQHATTDPASVLFPSIESLTLVSQKMCVVVYPHEGDSGTEETTDDVEEQHKPIFQPTSVKDPDSEEQP